MVGIFHSISVNYVTQRYLMTEIITCYTAPIQNQAKNESGTEWMGINDALMKSTADTCLEVLKIFVDVCLKEWDYLKTLPLSADKGVIHRKRALDLLIHSTKENVARYPAFDEKYKNFPSNMRRSVISDALGKVSSYMSNHENWEALSPAERGTEPVLGLPKRYAITFYSADRDTDSLQEGVISLKLYNGKSWEWYKFKVSGADSRYISHMKATRHMLSPVLEKSHGRYRIRFSFKESKTLVSDKNPIKYRILAVDLGINSAASWAVMEKDGAVHAKGVIRLRCEEDRLNHMINRKRMYQQAGKKSHSVYRFVKNANKRLSIETSRRIMDIAVLYDVDCIVFEHLERNRKLHGGKYRERIHMWKANDVQTRVELHAHRMGMRISRVCAWGTSKLAFDGSGPVLRGKDAGLETYSLCRFQNGKFYNCDLSAAQNIGARFFLREYKKTYEMLELPATPQRTYSTLVWAVNELHTNKVKYKKKKQAV